LFQFAISGEFFSTRKTDFVKFINTKNFNEQNKWSGKEIGTFLAHLQGKSVT
jgi:hypothetical protein